MNHTVPNNCWRTRNTEKVTADEGWDGEAVRSINAENRSGAMNIGNVIQGTTWL